MKQIFKNKYIKSFRFTSNQEVETFVANQGTKNILNLQDTYGDFYYCYVCYNSLTSEKQFVLSFSSDDDDLNFLFWDESNLMVLDTGKNLYLIDDKLHITAFFEITTPLIGLHLTNGNNLLVLEEASLKLINSEGQILKNELFDLIEDFNIENDSLSIQTSEESKVFELS